MAGLRKWFTGEIDLLGFPGLEGVFEYLATMSDEQVHEYLQSLLGTEPEIRTFAAAYINGRATGTIPEGLAGHAAPAAPSGTPQSTWAAVGGSANASGSKKAKRRGKNRSGAANGNGSNVNNDGKASFAKAVVNQRSSTPTSEQANAIKNSPAEQVRQKIREYRRSQNAVNCVRCGKIEPVIREDGACSFCHAPIFSMYEHDEGSSAAQSTHDKSSKSRQSDRSRRKRVMPVVLGRYVYLPDSTRDESRDALIKDIAGTDVFDPNTSVEDDIDRKAASSDTRSGSTASYYRNLNISREYLEESCTVRAESLKDLLSKIEEPDGPLPPNIYGRLQLDDISPNVCVYRG